MERFIHIGTSEMYGSVNHPTKEDEPIKPSSPYAASKVAFDLYLMSISKFLNKEAFGCVDCSQTLLNPKNIIFLKVKKFI